MQAILAFIAIRGDRPTRASLETLSRCRVVATAQSCRLDAVVLDADPARFVDTLAEYGPDRVLTVQSAAFADALNPPLTAALASAITEAAPSLVVFPSSETVKDVLGALAVRTNAAVLPDVASFDVEDGVVTALRPVMAAKRLARTESRHALTFVSVRSGSYTAEPVPSVPETVAIPFEFDSAGQRQTLREVVTAGGDTVDLSEAAAVVSAGRGVKDESGRDLVESLAKELDAAIGATRAVVETGLYPATAQIGQTGKVVAPQLYVALGISGAIQHVAGMANSKVIVAVNKDPDAPIFKYATYGIVGDLFRVVPAIVDAIKAAKSQE